jgi:DNA-directed RNA polymerase specialized sigma24 family protein
LRRRRRLQRVVDLLGRRQADRDGADDEELVAVRDLLERHRSADERSLDLLRYLHGFDATELAAMTGRSPEALRQRLVRARATLLAAAGAWRDGELR